MTMMVERSRMASRKVVLMSDWIDFSSRFATVTILVFNACWNVSTNVLVFSARVVNVAVSFTFCVAPSSNLMRADVGMKVSSAIFSIVIDLWRALFWRLVSVAV